MIAGRSRSPNRTGVALFDDYAVVDRHSQSFFIGSLSRMVHAGSHGRQEYKRPVAYDDPKRESITCYFQVYQNVQENVHDGIYKIGDSELRQLPFTDILTQVNLTLSEDGTLCVPDEEFLSPNQDEDVLPPLHLPLVQRESCRTHSRSMKES